MSEDHQICHALKLYIRDLFEVEEQTIGKDTNYKFLDMQVKTFQIHGVLTNIFRTDDTMIKIELSDATASIKVYYQLTNYEFLLSDIGKLGRKINYIIESSKIESENAECLKFLLNRIDAKENTEFDEGDYVLAIGKVSLDNMYDERVFIAFEIHKTSISSDLIWMMDLNNLYENYYQIVS